MNDDHGYTSQDVHEAATRGEDAFWDAVAASFPGITTGDLPVNVAHDLSTAMRNAIVEWVRANA